jgi:hypothetical protein
MKIIMYIISQFLYMIALSCIIALHDLKSERLPDAFLLLNFLSSGAWILLVIFNWPRDYKSDQKTT